MWDSILGHTGRRPVCFSLLLQLKNKKKLTVSLLLQSNHEHLFFQGEECLYLNTGDMVSETQDLVESTGTRPVIGGPVGHSTLVSNKKWIVIQVSWLQSMKKKSTTTTTVHL